MFLNIRKTVVLSVCLASALLAGAAGTDAPAARNPWGPDPFAPYAYPQAPRPAAAKLEAVRAVWLGRDRAKSFTLLFIACLCLVTLEMKVLRRTTGKQERLATILAGALRSGALEFEGGPRTTATSAWRNWMDPGEPETPEPEPERIMSRYAMLCYGGGRRDPLKSEEESTGPRRPRLAVAPGSAAGDDPGESTPQPHSGE